jgi:predicted double-glycine peptidase
VLQKEAYILPKLVRLAATPIKGTPKLFMKNRSRAELQALEGKVEGALTKHINGPLESGLRALKLNKAIGHGVNAATAAGQGMGHLPMVHGSIPIPKRLSDPATRKAWAMGIGDKATKAVAQNPLVALAPGGSALPFIEKGLGFLSNKLSPKTAAAFADEVVKIALAVVENAQRRRAMEKVAFVEPYQQITQWSCSAACLKAVLEHYGLPITEEQCIQAIGTREGRGAEVNEIAVGARKLGYEAFDWCFDSLEQVKALTDADMPVICDIQSFNNPGKGHYVVLTKIDDAGCHIMDPNTPGNMRLLTPDHWEARWWDWTMAAPRQLKEKWGVIVLPPVGDLE